MIKRKMIVAGLLAVSALFIASGALAEDVTSTSGAGKITIGTATDAEGLVIGLSSGVEVRYVNPGTTRALAQWYVAAAVHQGGNKGYATAQNLTNIMTMVYQPGDPTSTILTTIPTTAASKEDWPTSWTAQ